MLRKFTHILVLTTMLAGLFWLSPASPVRAATTHTVTNTNNSGAGSLRQAISNAVDGDTIDLSGINGTIVLASELAVAKNLTITGPGASKLTISGNNAVRVFHIGSEKTVSISGVTIANGRVVDLSGAGIVNNGNLTLIDVVVTDNVAVKSSNNFVRGGGISTELGGASLTVINSVVKNNTAVQTGGGILANSGTTLSLQNVVIDNNHALGNGSADGSGGGISILSNVTVPTMQNLAITNNSGVASGGGVNSFSSFSMVNSLVAGNSLAGYPDVFGGVGGGLYLAGTNPTYTFNNVTVSGNTANNDDGNARGGGLFRASGTLNFYNMTIAGNTASGAGGGLYGIAFSQNTIIAGNISTNSTEEDCAGTLTGSNTLIQVSTACTTTGMSGNIIGQDPLLGPLANNNGLTKTHALLPGSPAIDAGVNNTCGYDQRGMPRPQDGNGDGNAFCDMGAYEAPQIITYRSSGTQDGWVLESSETSNTGGTLNKGASTFNVGDDAANKQYRSILSFNTGALPDNTVITKVTLRVKSAGVTGGGNPITTFNGFMVDLKKGSFGTSALALSDFNTKPGKTLGAFKPTLNGGWYAINLTSGKAQVNLTGTTQIRLRFKLDDNNNFTANFLKLYSGNAGSSSKPQLIIEYYVP